MKYIISLFVISLFACKTKHHVEVIIPEDEKESFVQLLDRAAIEDKIVFVDLYTDWCLPCQLMDEIVYTDPIILDYLNTNFINLKMNAEIGEGPDLTVIYDIKEYPTLLFLDAKGKVLIRKNGAAFQQELVELGDSALALQLSKLR